MSTWKLYSVHIFVVLVFATPCILFGQTPEYIPQGWYVYPNSKLNHTDMNTLRCFNFSRNEWEVSSEGDDFKVTKWSGRKSDIPSLPPLLKVHPWMPGRTVNTGLRSAMHFAKGWLLAYDAGEFGRGLWLTNEDGSETKRILSDNVRAVMPLDGNAILVLSGLAHMTMDFGNALIFSNPDGLNITLQHSVHLDGAPSTYAKESDGSVVFVTTHGLSRITKSGELRNLAYFPIWTKMQYPNSMVVGHGGVIFIGMRMFVLRLTPNPTGYSEDWLLPNSCRKFELRQVDCICKP